VEATAFCFLGMKRNAEVFEEWLAQSREGAKEEFL
jgi:hypothetical protein